MKNNSSDDSVNLYHLDPLLCLILQGHVLLHLLEYFKIFYLHSPKYFSYNLDQLFFSNLTFRRFPSRNLQLDLTNQQKPLNVSTWIKLTRSKTCHENHCCTHHQPPTQLRFPSTVS